MPVEVQLVGKLLNVVFTGEVTPSDLGEYARRLEEEEKRLLTTPDRITFLTEALGTAIDFNKVDALAVTRSLAVLKNHIKSAVVVRTDTQFAYARMFQMLNTSPKTTVEIFRDSASAMAWLESGSDASSDRAKGR